MDFELKIVLPFVWMGWINFGILLNSLCILEATLNHREHAKEFLIMEITNMSMLINDKITLRDSLISISIIDLSYRLKDKCFMSYIGLEMDIRMDEYFKEAGVNHGIKELRKSRSPDIEETQSSCLFS